MVGLAEGGVKGAGVVCGDGGHEDHFVRRWECEDGVVGDQDDAAVLGGHHAGVAGDGWAAGAPGGFLDAVSGGVGGVVAFVLAGAGGGFGGRNGGGEDLDGADDFFDHGGGDGAGAEDGGVGVGGGVRSRTVDSRPISDWPPSRIRGMRPLSSANTWAAVVGLVKPERLAEGAAMGAAEGF